MLSNNALCLCRCPVRVTIFSTDGIFRLVSNFTVTHSYSIKSPFLGPANTCTNPHVHSLNLVISCGPSQLLYMLLIGNRFKLTASKHAAIKPQVPCWRVQRSPLIALWHMVTDTSGLCPTNLLYILSDCTPGFVGKGSRSYIISIGHHTKGCRG